MPDEVEAGTVTHSLTVPELCTLKELAPTRSKIKFGFFKKCRFSDSAYQSRFIKFLICTKHSMLRQRAKAGPGPPVVTSQSGWRGFPDMSTRPKIYVIELV